MTQNTWSCWNFNKLSRGSNEDGFIQTKYECDQYDEPNIMTQTSEHENFKRERVQQISKTRLNQTMMMHMMQLGRSVEGIIWKKKWLNKIWTW